MGEVGAAVVAVWKRNVGLRKGAVASLLGQLGEPFLSFRTRPWLGGASGRVGRGPLHHLSGFRRGLLKRDVYGCF